MPPRTLSPSDLVHSLENKLVALRAEVHEETKRHMVKLALLRADEANAQAELEAARREVKRLTLLSRTVSARTVSRVMSKPSVDRLLPPVPSDRRGSTHGGRSLESEHPFAVWLKETGKTLTDWAAENGTSRSRAKMWILPAFFEVDGELVRNKDVRKPPLVFAEIIERQTGLPATSDTWPQGIKRPKSANSPPKSRKKHA